MPGGIVSKQPKMASSKKNSSKSQQKLKIAKPVSTKSAKTKTKTHVFEKRATLPSVSKIGKQEEEDDDDDDADADAIEISSDEELDDDEVDAAIDAEIEADLMDVDEKTNGVNGVNGAGEDEDDEDDDDDDTPTFGELVRGQETVDVNAVLGLSTVTKTSTSATSTSGAAAAAAAPSLASLGNLLNAALLSGDDANIEVCFNTTTDMAWVRNTVERLDPSLAGVLLKKLAARMHRRPGRAHTLMSWVQWTLITHGGALASQPGVTKNLQELHRVLEERARGLNSLLLLKGKLDMLEAQMQLRRAQRARSALPNGGSGGGSVLQPLAGRKRARDEEEEATFYDEAEDDTTEGQILVNGAGEVGVSADFDDIDDDDDDEILEDEATDDSDDSDAQNDDDDEDVEEMDEDDEVNEDEIDFDDVDEDDDEDDDDDVAAAAATAPPPKVQKKSASAFSKRR